MASHQPMYLLLLYFLYILLRQTKGDDRVASTKILNQHLTNILFHNGSIYVAGSGALFKFNQDNLNLTATAYTCTPAGCEDVNKIFLLIRGDDEVLACGTGNNGLCFIRSINDSTFGNVTVQQTVEKQSKVLKVSTDPKRPAQAMVINDGHVLAAITYGKGIETDQQNKLTYSYLISARDLDNRAFGKVAEDRYLQLDLSNKVVTSIEDYLIDFKGNFQTENFSYFVTNQKDIVGGKRTVSKVIRLCQNDKFHYRTYADIELRCGNNYNIIEDAKIFSLNNSERVFVGTFIDGKTQNSAICVGLLKKIDDHIMAVQKRFIMTDCHGNNTSQRYLKNLLTTCNNESVLAAFRDIFSCTSDFYTHRYVIGTIALEMVPKFKWNATEGSITTVYGTQLEDRDPVVFAGTSKGKVLKFNLDIDNEDNYSLHLYDTIEVHNGFPIRHVSQHGENMFVMSDKKLFKYSSSNCSSEKCNVMTERNPLCGWCVMKKIATRRNDCSTPNNIWLSFRQGCVSFSTTPKGIAVRSLPQNVTINVTNLPDESIMITCILKNGDGKINTMQAFRDGSSLKCTVSVIPLVNTQATLQLLFNNIVVAESDFLFYDCSSLATCGKCIGTSESQCIWCSESMTCMSKNESCKNKTENIASQIEQCPQLTPTNLYVPADVAKAVTFQAKNLPNYSYQCEVSWNCSIVNNQELCETEKFISLSSNSTSVTCILSVSLKQKPYQVRIKYNGLFILDDDTNTSVTVYRCENLASDCSHCTNLNRTKYSCTWCNDKCVYNDAACNETCPAPKITKVEPTDGPKHGGTVVTISGTDLGLLNDRSTSVTIADTKCIVQDETDPQDTDFHQPVRSLIHCTSGALGDDNRMNKSQSLKLVVDGRVVYWNNSFTYWLPIVTKLEPQFGPKSGGTEITLSGSHLGIGNRNVQVQIGTRDCIDARVITVPHNASLVTAKETSFNILCTTAAEMATMKPSLSLYMNDVGVFNNQMEVFSYKADPVLTRINISKGFVSGGTSLSVEGNNMKNANVGKVTIMFGEDNTTEICKIVSSTQVICKVPKAGKYVKDELSKLQQERVPAVFGIDTTLLVSLDGVMHEFVFTYFEDPTFNEKNQIKFSNKDHKIKIEGQNLNLAASMGDFNITVGWGTCTVKNVTESFIECELPKYPGSKDFQVDIHVGNINETLCCLHYFDDTSKPYLIIAIVVVVLVLLFIGIGASFFFKYRAVGKKARDLERRLNDTEMDIKRVAREEFLDMHTCMTSVNKSLDEQGLPYLDYQQFASNVLFVPDYLLKEGVISKDKMADEYSDEIIKSLKSLELLISNKLFLVTVISVMDKQRKFFVRDKYNFAGNLCAILMGRMDYLKELLDSLLSDVIKNSSDKNSQKSLFRRCESISEKLLSNWLSLCMYPHIKASSGSPLYLLYMSILKTIEAGPIDAITGDSKYTLAEEKLLKWTVSGDNNSDDLKFEAKNLTLNMVVDNEKEIFHCKVLNCDTITQVKKKCLHQIYVNPVSKLGVAAEKFNLEWHAGSSGIVCLQDNDISSKQDKGWIRLNTLAHYNVKDGSNMVLKDPHKVNHEEVNSEERMTFKIDQRLSVSHEESEALLKNNEKPENSLQLTQWHLIKKDEDNIKQRKLAISELYFSRLLSTKLQIISYLQSFFDVVLDKDQCAPPTKMLYDFLDDIGEQQKIDSETLHGWKSHSYAIRLWGNLIKNPSLLFDVSVPNYVEANLEVISQVFNESFTMSSQKFTTDTPSRKLIFLKEMIHYREKVTEFYKDVKVNELPKEEIQRYLSDVNTMQQTTNFDKSSALMRFYEQVKPYVDEIIENLLYNEETSNLELHSKLCEVRDIMNENTKL